VLLFWPGTQVSAQFSGATLSARIRDDNGRNHYAVIIDDSLRGQIALKYGTHDYVLASALPPGKHRVILHKLTDWFDGSSEFIDFIQPNGMKTKAATTARKWKLEFYGNSITVGAAMFSKADSLNWPGSSTHNYFSYGAVAARKLNASARFIASSGIGLMVSWGSLIMPEIFNLTNPDDSGSKWLFSSYQPDVVIVNLMQNDHALIGQENHQQFIRRFGKTAPGADTIIRRYTDFISTLRACYPNAYILCCLGSMSAVRPGSPFPDYIRKAVALLNDKRMGTHFFKPIKGNEHPNKEEHQQMADELVRILTPILVQKEQRK
ncbi:MAG TPA: SGNH/GDSL hydrolase family protein, partial [Niabella sp.]|nr:SGNH/GDSL hydrolase family protein [Niabella sp.]